MDCLFVFNKKHKFDFIIILFLIFLKKISSNVSNEFSSRNYTCLPHVHLIKLFLSSLFSMALLGPECIIVSLVCHFLKKIE